MKNFTFNISIKKGFDLRFSWERGPINTLFSSFVDNADSSTLHAVTFLRTPEILTVNSIGQLKIWDFRQQGNEPSQILSL